MPMQEVEFDLSFEDQGHQDRGKETGHGQGACV